MAAKEKPATTDATVSPVPWAPQGAIAAPSTEAASATPLSDADPAPPEVEVADELVDTVTVTVPKAFKLRLSNFHEIPFKAGVQEMEREHATHWFSKANGVQIYKR